MDGRGSERVGDEAAHVEARVVFDHRYEMVSVDYGSFGDHENCATWMAGVMEGAMSVGARMGLTTSTRISKADDASGVRLHLAIVKDFTSGGKALASNPATDRDRTIARK